MYSGIVEPIKSDVRQAKLGIRKHGEEDFFISKENILRKKLDIEIEETEEQIKKRGYANKFVRILWAFSYGTCSLQYFIYIR